MKEYGFKVSNLYIGQAKEKFGLEKRGNYNVSKKEKQVIPQCPEEKLEAITTAFQHIDGWLPSGFNTAAVIFPDGSKELFLTFQINSFPFVALKEKYWKLQNKSGAGT